MSNYEHQPGCGSLFKNVKKHTESPDWIGVVKDHSGKKWRLLAWLKSNNNGNYLSLKLAEYIDRDANK